MNKQVIKEHIRAILNEIGEKSNRNGLIETPDRIARMYSEIFRGYDVNQMPHVTTFKNGADGICSKDIICDSGSFYSMCEHHMMPFFGTYTFGYIPAPNGKILGLSKIARIVDYYSARLQLQERLCIDIVSALQQALEKDENPEDYPQGLIIQMQAKHLCKSMRGSKKEGVMVATYGTGCFATLSEQRKEFEAIVRNINYH